MENETLPAKSDCDPKGQQNLGIETLPAESESMIWGQITPTPKCCVCKTQRNLIFVMNDWICRKHDKQAENGTLTENDYAGEVEMFRKYR